VLDQRPQASMREPPAHLRQHLEREVGSRRSFINSSPLRIASRRVGAIATHVA
jgi:hypothetical protein